MLADHVRPVVGDAFTKAIQAKPDYASAYNHLGSLQFRKGDLKNAHASFRHALAIEPENALSLNCLGRVLAGLGKPREAAELLEKALQLAPGDFHALNTLATIWSNQLGDPRKGIGYIRRAMTMIAVGSFIKSTAQV